MAKAPRGSIPNKGPTSCLPACLSVVTFAKETRGGRVYHYRVLRETVLWCYDGTYNLIRDNTLTAKYLLSSRTLQNKIFSPKHFSYVLLYTKFKCVVHFLYFLENVLMYCCIYMIWSLYCILKISFWHFWSFEIKISTKHI